MSDTGLYDKNMGDMGMTGSTPEEGKSGRVLQVTIAVTAFTCGTLLSYLMLPMQSSIITFIAVICAAASLVAAGVMAFLYRSKSNDEQEIFRSLGEFSQHLVALEEGNLSADITLASVVTADIAGKINQRQQAQRHLIRDIIKPFDVAVTEIHKIGGTASGLITKGRELTESVKDSTTAATRMVQSSNDIKKSTAEAMRTSQRNSEQVARGYELTKDMSKASADVRESVQETSKSAKRQGELIQSVTAAAEYIQALNNKISVVAINTRIEAEKAGEHGRPFLGIAEAIGDLLREAEEEGRKIIADVRLLQNMSADNMGSMENTVATVVTILEYIERLDSSLEEINAGSTAINSIIKSVDEAAGQSTSNAQHMNSTLQKIRDRNREITKLNNYTLAGVNGLEDSMDDVAKGLKRFSIEQAEDKTSTDADKTSANTRSSKSAARVYTDASSGALHVAASPA